MTFPAAGTPTDEPAARSPRVAIVTAASRGIGAGCARSLAERGWKVALLARSREVERLAAELGGVGVVGSVTEAQDLERVVAAAVERWGGLDGAVLNTGHPAKGDLPALDDAAWQEGFEMILLFAIRAARLVTPHLAARGGGSIVAISSLWAVEPHLDAPISSTFRAALSAFAKLHATRHGTERVRMNCVLPGFVDTYPAPDAILRAIPMGRQARPDEIGGFVAWLLSPEAAYLTGQSLRIDGGLTRSL